MANKPNFKLKDVKKEFSSRDVSGVKEDQQSYFRGVLESIDLILTHQLNTRHMYCK